MIDYAKRKDEAPRDQNIKSLIDFDVEYCSSIRSLAVKERVKLNVSRRYLNGKMLMFSEILLKSFVYNLIDVFMFPNDVAKKTYDQYKIQKCYLYVAFIFELGCAVDKRKSRQIIFEVMIKSKMFNRLDLSDDFWDHFGDQNKKLKKQ